ncbi:flagellar biosynthesis regulator FlaF [Nisaea acidiphila]|uniref:Flagellar biosynthesis regulator FlaF n=1 Tax=Nisaea acidiphila TaxID=1862145 RepID=A0A9J7AS84_9PROT|nr:flagellar biosynthesis regulator FlaF [Nisaea acidiphila]UUX50499.1 flagellar biosynthesis regulator FlaF [Nisaea acidiphila]
MRQGYAAYSSVQKQTESHQQVEYRLLGQVTSALLKAQDTECTLQDRLNAVLWNGKVWDAFLCDLSEPGNQLPQGLKTSLIQLAHWVARETELAIETNVGLDALINVNRQIMEGLQDQFRLAEAS